MRYLVETSLYFPGLWGASLDPTGSIGNIWLMCCCYLTPKILWPHLAPKDSDKGSKCCGSHFSLMWTSHKKATFQLGIGRNDSQTRTVMGMERGPDIFRGPWDLRHPTTLQQLLSFSLSNSSWLEWIGVRETLTILCSIPWKAQPQRGFCHASPGGAGNAPPCPDTALAKPSDTSVGTWPAGLGRKDRTPEGFHLNEIPRGK